MVRQLSFFFTLLLSIAANATERYKILNEVDQDRSIFTQGFVLDENTLYISSGLYRKSFLKSISETDTRTQAIEPQYFAEGITIVGDKLYLLTWRAGELLVFDKRSLAPIDTRSYDGQGWGLTHDNDYFLMSDGSHYIQIRQLDDFSIKKYLRVTRNGRPLKQLNELEYAKGYLWANVWFSNAIYKIDPKTGHVVDEWDLSAIVKNLNLKEQQAVLNGIAYDSKSDAFWLTGKLWPKRYLVKFDAKQVE